MLNLGAWLWNAWRLFTPRPLPQFGETTLGQVPQLPFGFSLRATKMACRSQTSKVSEGDIVLFTGGPMSLREGSPRRDSHNSQGSVLPLSRLGFPACLVPCRGRQTPGLWFRVRLPLSELSLPLQMRTLPRPPARSGKYPPPSSTKMMKRLFRNNPTPSLEVTLLQAHSKTSLGTFPFSASRVFRGPRQAPMHSGTGYCPENF